MKHQASLFHIGQWQGVSDLPLLGSCMHNIGLAKKAKQNVLENCKYIHAFYIWYCTVAITIFVWIQWIA
jgi:hypothetical protein